jgi:excisionase family DNA binding protein
MKKKEVVTIKPGYLRPAAAAKYLGVSVRTLTNWVQARMVAQIKPSNRVSLFRISDLDAALDRFRIRAFGEY